MDLIDIAKADQERRSVDPLKLAAGVGVGAIAGRAVGGLTGARAATKNIGKRRKKQIMAGKKHFTDMELNSVRGGARLGTMGGAAVGGAYGMKRD